MIDTLEPMAAGAEIAIEPPARLELPPVMADRTRLARILMNLGSNAIGLSAAALPADTSRAAEAGFSRYLTKPVKVDELTRALEELLERGPD